jgi:SAM-dependent MidA family methyltransferase
MSTPLAERLAARIDAEGPLEFSAFMQTALYDPEHGYYADPAFTTGRKGDFATAPDVGPLMGATLARPVAKLADQGGRFVEIGPGSGRLAVDVLDALPEAEREAIDIVLVEPFPARHDDLATKIEDEAGVEARIVEAIDQFEPARSLVVANEVLDAFPVDVVKKRATSVEAKHVDVEDGRFVERWLPADDATAKAAREPLSRLPAGTTYELARGLDAFFAGLADTLDPGAAVFFDYGGDTENVWGQREDGTLRAFKDHQHVDPLTAPGETDVTADVDFSRVRSIAHEHGLDEAAYGGQERLLVHLGLVEAARERDRVDDVKRLVVPGGAGGFGKRFRAIVLDDGFADTLGLQVDLDDPEIWTKALEDLEGAGGIAGFGAGELV